MQTLAEFIAILSIVQPAKAAGLNPILAFIPLYAQREGLTIENVWAFPPAHAFERLAGLIPLIITPDALAAVQAAAAPIMKALDPAAITAKLTEALASSA